MTSVFIAFPAFGAVNSAHTTSSLIALTKALTERGWFGGFSTMSFPVIEDLRAMFLTIWFDRLEASHILFIDADMQFDPQLVIDMIEFDQPLVGCIYPKRTLPIAWVGSAFPDRPQVTVKGFVEFEGVGFGVTLIRRDCMQGMIDKGNVELEPATSRTAVGNLLIDQGANRCIRAFDKVITEGRSLSEDFSFCWRHRDAGGQVWAATHHKITHVGDYGFSGRYADVLETAKGPVHVSFAL